MPRKQNRTRAGKRTRPLWGQILVWLLVGLAGCSTRAPRPEPSPVAGPVEKVAPLGYLLYEVQRGDTLYGLGQRFSVPWQEIAAANNIRDVSDLKVGKLLLVPRVAGVEPSALSSPEPTARLEASRRHVSAADLHRGSPSARFWWPTAGTLLRRYGDEVRGLAEPGIALAAPAGTEVCAVAGGTVITCLQANPSAPSAWGNVVAVAHSGNMVSWYAHLDRILTSKGRRVARGEVIGTVGSSGAADRAVLAFRLFRNERPVDPLDYLP